MPSRPFAVRSAIFSPPGTEISTIASTLAPSRSGDLFEIGADHRARRGIDRGLADRQRQAGPGHRPDAFARLEAHARALRRETNGRDDQRAMGDVRIVARVLDDARAGETGAEFVGRERELRPQALRQRDRNRIGKLAGQQRFEGGARRPAGAGAGRPAALERRAAFRLGHGRWPSARCRLCLGGRVHDPRPHDRRASLGQRQDDGDARPPARVQAPRRGRRRPQIRPDYIDPAFHAAASGRDGVNLDSWAMAPDLLGALAAQAAGTNRPRLVRSLDGPVRRRSGDKRAHAAPRPTWRRRLACRSCW